MSLAIGRRGWIGVATETTYGVPVNPTDYAPFNSNTIIGVTDSIEVTSANTIRDEVFSSIVGRQWAKGDVEINLDPKISGYFLGAALGADNVVQLATGVQQHTITRNNSNVAHSLTLINNRITDQFEVSGAVVDTLEIHVADSLATLKASVIGQFPVDTTSGTIGSPATLSGTIFSFKNTQFAFGSTVANAANGANIKTSDVTVRIANAAEAVFRHGASTPASINVKQFTAECDFTLFFENLTDRNSYYTGNKQAAVLQFTGAPLSASYNESLLLRFYQTHIHSFALETGLNNFFAEKGKLKGEYDNVNAKTLDAVLTNGNSVAY